jgi:phospholipid N-methyltransferase
MKLIGEDVLAVLSRCQVDGNTILLTCGQLDRKQYVAVNAVLESMGGKWNRKAKGHVFPGDPAGKLEMVLLTGEIDRPEDFGFFPTPSSLARRVVKLADISPGQSVLEPSAGDGALADEIIKTCPRVASLSCIELLPDKCAILTEKGYRVELADFLGWDPPAPFDRVVMNPPFARQADIDHVNKAWECLRPGGKLVSIMSAGIVFRENRKTVALRELIESHGAIERNPDGAFRESGTMVNTVTVVMTKKRMTTTPAMAGLMG